MVRNLHVLLYTQVVEKTHDQEMPIGRIDAIFEVYTDRIVKNLETCDEALLWIFKQDISEFSVCTVHMNM